RFAHGLGAPFAEAAIVFGRAAFVGEAGDDECVRGAAEEVRYLIDFASFAGRDGVAVEPEMDRTEFAPIHIPAEEGHAFLPVRQRRSIDVISIRRSSPCALLAFRARGESKSN